MTVQVVHAEAEKKLIEAFKTEPKPTNGNTTKITRILQGSHKTYKYVLITGLLGKACNKDVDPLALQAGAPLSGAYDARSLCHKVFVPFERNFLSNALGGSNEPFLNKPARFTHLSVGNAVRAGKDRETLSTLIDVLSSIKTSEDASRYLSFALRIVTEIARKQIALNKTSISINPTLLEIYDFIVHFLEKSFEGETCTIVVGALESVYHNGLKGGFIVGCHKVNQSGSSSKEVGDIDIFSSDGKYRYSIEVKDKTFSDSDVGHAFKKIIANGGMKGAFIYGPRSSFNESALIKHLKSYEQNKFLAVFMDIYNYAKLMLFKSNMEERREFMDRIMNTAIEINARDETKLWIHETTKRLGWT